MENYDSTVSEFLTINSEKLQKCFRLTHRSTICLESNRDLLASDIFHSENWMKFPLNELFRFFECILYSQRYSIDYDPLIPLLNSDYKDDCIGFICRSANDTSETLQEILNTEFEAKLKLFFEYPNSIFDEETIIKTKETETFCNLYTSSLRKSTNYVDLHKEDKIRELFQIFAQKDDLDSYQLTSLYMFLDQINKISPDFVEGLGLKIEIGIRSAKSRKLVDIIMNLLLYLKISKDEFYDVCARIHDVEFNISTEKILALLNVNEDFRFTFLDYFLQLANDDNSKSIFLQQVIEIYIKLLTKLNKDAILTFQEVGLGNSIFQLNDYALRRSINELADCQLTTCSYDELFMNNYIELIDSEPCTEVKALSDHLESIIFYAYIDDNPSRFESRMERTKIFICNLVSKLIKIIQFDDFYNTMKIIEISFLLFPDLLENIISSLENSQKRWTKLIISEIREMKWKNEMEIKATLIEVMENLIDLLSSSPNIDDINNFQANIKSRLDFDPNNYEYDNISYENSKDLDTMGRWLISILFNIGFNNLKSEISKLIETPIQYKAYLEYQKSMFEKSKGSLAFNLLFNSNLHFVVHQYLASQYWYLFKFGLNNNVHWNYIIFNNEIAMLLLFNKPKELSEKIKVKLRKLMKTSIVKEAFELCGLDISQGFGYENRVFYSILPPKVSGTTIFGGTILLTTTFGRNFMGNEQSTAYIIIFFFIELAHAIRKTNQQGNYNINQTNTTKADFSEGGSGLTDVDIIQHTEGDQIETVLFGNYIRKINSEQIDFLNRTFNWDQTTLYLFKKELKDLEHKPGISYQINRETDNYFIIERELHHH